jgi:hypothetical protein
LVPAHDRLGPDDGYGIQDARKAAIKPNGQNPIGPTQIQSMRRAPSKHGQLMAQNHNFDLKPRSRLEALAPQADEKEGNCDHQPQLCCDSSTAATPPDRVFGSDSRSATNVIGNSLAAAAVAKFEKELGPARDDAPASVAPRPAHA